MDDYSMPRPGWAAEWKTIEFMSGLRTGRGPGEEVAYGYDPTGFMLDSSFDDELVKPEPEGEHELDHTPPAVPSSAPSPVPAPERNPGRKTNPFRGNNPFGSRGTESCAPCRRRKGKV